jgi:cytoskeleton protein RodZ
MNSVGSILKAERERQQREVAEIAGELCITQRYLRAIEQDDLKNLPGSFFYKSFAKQYAAILGIDETALFPGIAALTALAEPPPDPGTHRKPIRDMDPIVREGNRNYFQDSRIGWSVAGLIGVVLVCSGFYAWYNKGPQTPVAAKVVVVPQAVITPVKVQVPEAPASVAVTTTTGPDGLNHVELNLSATEKTWISIVCDGKPIFSGVLEPSQTKTLSGIEVAKMKVGNAGGLDVRWNGKPIGPIGPRGQVRVLLFTPENFQILQPSAAM